MFMYENAATTGNLAVYILDVCESECVKHVEDTVVIN